MISGVVTLQNAGKVHTPEIPTAIMVVCIFQFFRDAKRERLKRALFRTYCEKKKVRIMEFSLEYHKASVKNKHRNARTFRIQWKCIARDSFTIRAISGSRAIDKLMRPSPRQIMVFSLIIAQNDHDWRNYITNGIQTARGRTAAIAACKAGLSSARER